MEANKGLFSCEMRTAGYYREVEKGESKCDCVRCGKAIKDEATAQYVEMEDDMGWFPVGTDCAKKLAKLGVKVVKSLE